MPNALIHIGFNKCGSTALQKWLGENAPALADEGVVYRRSDPRADVICTNPQLAVLAHSLAARPLPQRPISTVLGISDAQSQNRVARTYQEGVEALAKAGGFRLFVASNEALVARHMDASIAGALADWLKRLFKDVRFVAYIRRPLPWLISLHGHATQLGETDRPLTEFLTRAPRAWFGPVLRVWHKAVGDALDVRLFHESWLKGRGLISDFASVLGVSAQEPQAQPVNMSYKTPGLPIHRRMGGDQRALPPRPSVPPETAEAVRNANASDLTWIEDTFFATRRDEFRAWSTQI